jgi:ribA/ribD-fused uncharacterized protein
MLVLPVKKSRNTFSKVAMPYAMKLLDQELITYMNAGFRYLTDNQTRKFREPTEMSLDEMLDEGLKQDNLLDIVADAFKGPAPVPGAEEAKEAEEAAEEARPEPAKEQEKEEASDNVDDGEPEKNDVGEEPPAGSSVIDFSVKTPYKEFNNYHKVNMTIDGKVWPTVEHYFQAMKFPANPELQEQIRLAKTPALAKTLGRKGSPMRDDWETYRMEVMEKALRAKFSNPEMKAKLLGTKDAILREASPQDNFWGIGRKKKGANHLGKLLMKIRGEMSQEGGDFLPEQVEQNVIVLQDQPQAQDLDQDIKVIKINA